MSCAEARVASIRTAVLITRRCIFHSGSSVLSGIAAALTVAQTSGLLYRRLPAGKASCSSKPFELSGPAGWKPAIRQTGGLCYQAQTKILALTVCFATIGPRTLTRGQRLWD